MLRCCVVAEDDEGPELAVGSEATASLVVEAGDEAVRPRRGPAASADEAGDYDPRRPEYVLQASGEEVAAGRAALRQQQIAKLERFVARHANSGEPPHIVEHYRKLLVEMRAESEVPVRRGFTCAEPVRSFASLAALSPGICHPETPSCGRSSRRSSTCLTSSSLELWSRSSADSWSSAGPRAPGVLMEAEDIGGITPL
mmetsp:Transcript_97195/g.279793  ORF Transcript_97195/g.279793 Transcript_97195/m.279793 type:complete len:199 (+) Transcript_97195:75-671(+)